MVLIAAYIFYSYFFSSESNQDELLVSSAQRDPAVIVGNEIIAALNQIESLRLSRDIFEDPVYRSLIDRSEPIPEEPVGKTNPFAPIGASSISNRPQITNTTATTTRTNTIINTTNRPPASQPVI